MSTPVSHQHHYVPRWYQKRFLAPSEDKLWYLDLKPEKVAIGKQRSYTPRFLFRSYPAQCFWLQDLYLLRFGKRVSDVIERVFFGRVDDRGDQAVRFFTTSMEVRNGLNDAYKGLLSFIAAQRLRTPRGLDWIKAQARVTDQNSVLLTLEQMYEAYNAMWMEGTWEIVTAKHSATKFLISDDPVTFFTRTIFPLGPEHCLLITHLQLIRNPWHKPLEERANARLFGTTLAYLPGIQHGRELEEQEVARINFILKRHATKYIAAGRKEDLYPENALGAVDWSKLDDGWFLFPNPWKVHFTSGMMMGGLRGRNISIDEYGHDPQHPQYQNARRREQEHQSFEAGQHEWAKRRIGKPLAQTLHPGSENASEDGRVREYLQEIGLLPPDKAAAE